MQTEPLPRGAVSRALEAQLFGRFTTRETTVSVGVVADVLLQNNPERIGYVLFNTGGKLITLSLKRNVVSQVGLILSQQGDSMTTNYIEDAQFPTHEISAIADLAGGELFIIEFIRESL